MRTRRKAQPFQALGAKRSALVLLLLLLLYHKARVNGTARENQHDREYTFRELYNKAYACSSYYRPTFTT